MKKNLRNAPLEDANRNPFQEEVAARIREAHAGMMARDFAVKCGILPQALAGYERAGGSLPGASLIKKFCEASGVSADWLLGLSEVKLRSEVAAQRKANLDAVIEKQAAALERFSRMLDEQLPKP